MRNVYVYVKTLVTMDTIQSGDIFSLEPDGVNDVGVDPDARYLAEAVPVALDDSGGFSVRASKLTKCKIFDEEIPNEKVGS